MPRPGFAESSYLYLPVLLKSVFRSCSLRYTPRRSRSEKHHVERLSFDPLSCPWVFEIAFDLGCTEFLISLTSLVEPVHFFCFL